MFFIVHSIDVKWNEFESFESINKQDLYIMMKTVCRFKEIKQFIIKTS